MATIVINTATGDEYLLSGETLVALTATADYARMPILRVGATDYAALNAAFTGP
jgi:hypothetical protein